MQENAKIIVFVAKFVFSMSVIVSSSACKCGGIMGKSLLFDGRQQRVRRPSNDGCMTGVKSSKVIRVKADV